MQESNTTNETLNLADVDTKALLKLIGLNLMNIDEGTLEDISEELEKRNISLKGLVISVKYHQDGEEKLMEIVEI